MFALMCAVVMMQVEPSPNLLPLPDTVQMGSGRVRVGEEMRISCYTDDLLPLGEVLAGEIELVTGIRPSVGRPLAEPPASTIVLAPSSVYPGAAPPGGLGIKVAAEETLATGETNIEIAHATTLLVQAIKEDANGFYLPVMTASDRPDSDYRAVSIDVARQVHSIASIKDSIRLARMYRLRYIQLHLTDDQNFTYPFPGVTDKLQGNFAYTREELLDLVAYADARGVTLIPELDLPGHSTKLMQSGYLNPSRNHADVADPANNEKIFAIIDDMCEVFDSSPYFHIGGDESGAGEKLVPFIAAVNQHLRSQPEGSRKRLIVWEGFHGAPTDLVPATGDDRVIVMSWESGYNPPWVLLKAGYEVINCSWKPLYIVSGGLPRYPHIAQRNWSPELIYQWQKNDFWHWQPGQPVFEDQGPQDPNLSDGRWDASYIGRERQVMGGSLLVWEQAEPSLIPDLRWRVPVVAERLANPAAGQSWAQFSARMRAVDERVMTIVRPIEIAAPTPDPHDPLAADFVRMQSPDAVVGLRRRTPLEGTMRFVYTPAERDALNRPVFRRPSDPTAGSTDAENFYYEPAGGAIRAQLFRPDGTPVEGIDELRYAWVPERVRVTSYSVDRRPAPFVPDFAAFADDRVEYRTTFPELRGPYNVGGLAAHRMESTFYAPESGEYTFEVQTLDGRADIFLDGKRIIQNTPPDQKVQKVTVHLTAGPHPFAAHHLTGAILPIFIVEVSGPGIEGKKEISAFLRLGAVGS